MSITLDGTNGITQSGPSKANAYLDAAGGNTATINGKLPIAIGDVPASGGMTLLGTLTTTSGTTQTLSGLTLTSYKKLEVWINGVSSTSTAVLYLNGSQIAPALSVATAGWFGIGCLDLTTGTGVFTDNTGTSANGAATSFGNVHGLTTASTSISFQIFVGTFDAGSILVYGVK